MLGWQLTVREKKHFEEQLIEHINSMYTLALKLTHNTEDAQDLVQQASMRAFRFYRKFKEGTNFKAWILTILRNLFINEYRRRKRQPPKISLDIQTESFIHIPQISGAEEEILTEKLQEAVSELPEELRTAITLFYLEGFSYKDIAKIMDVPIGTVMSRLFTARQTLKKKMFVPDAKRK